MEIGAVCAKAPLSASLRSAPLPRGARKQVLHRRLGVIQTRLA